MSDESGKINLGDYSDYVRIVFNSRMDKWELNMLEDGKHVLRKHFFDKSEAEMQALHYLGQIGVLNSGNLSKEIQRKKRKAQYPATAEYTTAMQEACGESRSRDTEAPDCLDIIEAKRKPSRPKRITWLKNQPSRRQ